MDSLYSVVLKSKQDVNSIASNPTLDAFDLDYCRDLDSLAQKVPFVEYKIKKCIKELRAAKGISYNAHYRNAYEAYNEAVAYFELQQRGVEVSGIMESSSASPDFKIKYTRRDWEGKQTVATVYVEVKSLGFADGNNEYKRVQDAALDCNIRLEEQRRQGRGVCSSEYWISPLSNKDTGPTSQIEEFNKKIKNNLKKAQFQYGGENDTVLYVDFSQLLFPFRKEDCLPVYPNIFQKYSASGRLWMLAFGKEGDRVFSAPEFVGKGTIDKDLNTCGVLNGNDYIKGVIFCVGCKKRTRSFFGFYRHNDLESDAVALLNRVCSFVNDDKNSNGYLFYEELKKELKERYAQEERA